MSGMISSFHAHTKLKAELTIQCKTQLYLYTTTHHVLSKSTWYWGENFPVLLLQILINELSSAHLTWCLT